MVLAGKVRIDRRLSAMHNAARRALRLPSIHKLQRLCALALACGKRLAHLLHESH